MKTLFYSLTILIFITSVGLMASRDGQTKTEVGVKHTNDTHRYINQTFNYSIDVPEGYIVDETAPELVLIEKGGMKIRINFGCYEFGLEGLREFSEPVVLGERVALKQTFYLNDELVFKRIVMDVQSKCIYLEYWASEQLEWQDVEELVKSFRITE